MYTGDKTYGGKHFILEFVIDVSASVRPNVDELQQFVAAILPTIQAHEALRGALEGGGIHVRVLFFNDNMIDTTPDFQNMAEWLANGPPAVPDPSGLTHSGEALRKALDDTSAYKEQLRAEGIPYCQPVIFFVTDGKPEGRSGYDAVGDFREAAREARSLETCTEQTPGGVNIVFHRLEMQVVSVGDADMALLNELPGGHIHCADYADLLNHVLFIASTLTQVGGDPAPHALAIPLDHADPADLSDYFM